MDSENEFEPKLGRMKARGSPRGRKYLHRVLAAAAVTGGVRAAGRGGFQGSRIGRGAAAGRLLASRDRLSGLRGRRAAVKARLVRLGGGMAAARAHLRYVERDSGRADGGPGQLYAAAVDVADGRAFLERSEGDRHQFRFIVSAEDGADYEDLRPLIRRVMARMEEDLGTGLDWVAADHLDTGHPHSHIVVRGKDDRGRDLVIAREYIARGLRERVCEIVALDLGPRTDLEIEQTMRRDVGAERLTDLDRRFLRDADRNRELVTGGGSMRDTALRVGRLKKLEALGLAEDLGRGRWRLAEGLEASLRSLGERGDIIRTMQRVMTASNLERAPVDRVIQPADLAGRELVGRVVARGLADEARDRHYLIVDGVDGRIHHVGIGRGDAVEPLPTGAIVRVSARAPAIIEADRKVASIAAASGGRYSETLHLEREPEADPEYVRAHVRRLEAMRRAVGGPERLSDGNWSIGADHLARAAAFEARRVRDAPVRVELLSPLRLEALPHASGATWLDRDLVSETPQPLREAGFGAEVRAARTARQRWLLAQGLAEDGEGGLRYRRNLLALLRQRELLSIRQQLSDEFGAGARFAEKGEKLRGVLERRIDLASGRFGVLRGSGELMLVPWRRDLERQLGRELSGRIGAAGLSWSRGRERGVEIG